MGHLLIILQSTSSGPSVKNFFAILLVITLAGLYLWFCIALARKMRRSLRETGRDIYKLISSDEFLAVAGVVGGAWAATKLMGAGLSFLRGIDWENVDEGVRRALEEAVREVETQPSGLTRLDRAEQMLSSGDEIEREAAAMLTSATLELGLRVLARRAGISPSGEESSLVGLAIRLAKGGMITWAEQREIQYYATAIRNRVMHGDLGAVESQEVASLIGSTRRFFVRHSLG